MTSKRILVINPGSTTTKIAIYEDDRQVWIAGEHFKPSQLAKYTRIVDQLPRRREFVGEALAKADQPMRFDAVIGRGGLLHPTQGGVYEVDEHILHDMRYAEMEHASNLGALLAADIARECGCKAFIADPVVVDEMIPEARLTGMPGVERRSIFHALNSRAVSRRWAKEQGKAYEDVNVIVVHIGGGCSVSAHRKGRIIDVNNALNGDGPFSPERAGTVPAGQLAELCFSGKYTLKEVLKMLSGRGGLIALLGDNNVKGIVEKARKDCEPHKRVLAAMMYNVAKYSGSMYVALRGQVDAIIITGGIAFSDYCMNLLLPQIDYMAPVALMPGEDEMGALALNALGALNGELPLQVYNPRSRQQGWQMK